MAWPVLFPWTATILPASMQPPPCHLSVHAEPNSITHWASSKLISVKTAAYILEGNCLCWVSVWFQMIHPRKVVLHTLLEPLNCIKSETAVCYCGYCSPEKGKKAALQEQHTWLFAMNWFTYSGCVCSNNTCYMCKLWIINPQWFTMKFVQQEFTKLQVHVGPQ